MAEMLERLAEAGVGAAATLRGLMVIVGALRSFRQRQRFVTLRFGAAELIVVPEPLLMVAAGLWLIATAMRDNGASAGESTAALFGAAAAIAGWALIAWTARSWPAIYTGHGWQEGQTLITTGAYGFVRHPVYLAALVLWCALAIASLEPLIAGIAFLYALPAYYLYARSEEEMMGSQLGDTYRRYKASVPMLVPHPRLMRRS